MVLRHITASAVTSGTQVNYSPPAGYKWRIQLIQGFLSASATVGTRQLNIGLTMPVNVGGSFINLANTGGQTGVSAVYQTYMSPVEAEGSSNGSLWHNQASLEIDHNTEISVSATLLSGDTYTFDILVDEQVDD